MNNIIPKHVSIIMDGNGRWATNKGLNRTEGHKKGAEILEELSLHAIKKGIKVLSVYAFSTDNFKRPEKEVTFLMNLFIKKFTDKFQKIIENDIKVVFSGRRENLRKDVLEAMDYITEKSKDNKKGILNICLNYGGQEEIVDACKRIINDKVDINSLDKETFNKYLYQDLPPIDLLIRTSGELRVSNYMLYQMAYSEFYFTDVLFPDFNSDEFDKALEEFSNRNRRFGKVETK